MAKVRLNAFNSSEYVFEHICNENLTALFERFISTVDERKIIEDYFEIFINGHLIDREFWKITTIKKNDNVLIALTPKSGDFGAFLKQAAVLAAVVTAASLTGGMSLYAQAAWAMAASVGASLLMNALIPPEGVGTATGDLYNASGSQTYSISGQSNQIKKYSTVPKVYGTHRMFPVVAASPYTDFIADERTGELIQFFYCVYDFGLGPLNIKDLKIGETPIENFTDVNYRYVDFNLPNVNEGDWQDKYSSILEYYKGDVNQDSISAVINANRDDTGSIESEYQITRNSDDSSNGDNQEIGITFGFPKGLITYGTNGGTAIRTVELNIDFREVGTSDWFSFNDDNKVSSFSTVGASEIVIDPVFLFRNRNEIDRYFPLYTVLASYSLTKNEARSKTKNFTDCNDNDRCTYYQDIYGLPKGSKYFYSNISININDYISLGGEVVGKVEQREVVSGGYKYTLYEGFPYSITVFSDYTKRIYNITSGTRYYSYNVDSQNKNPSMRGFFDIQNSSNGILRISSNNPEAIFATLKFKPITTSQVEVRVTRIRSYGGYDYQIKDEMTWVYLTTRYDRNPIVTDRRHTFFEIKIKATDQLNGTLDNLNAVCSSVLDYYDTNDSTWKKKETNNPAWIFLDILTGDINKNNISKNRIDVNSISEWASFCDEIPIGISSDTFTEKRFKSNFVLDYAITVSDLINQLTSSAQASLNIYNGKYGVLIDKEKTIPVQVFTPRNSWNFSSTRSYSEIPDGFKVKYVDSLTDWNIKEEIVYNDGFDETNAIVFEELETFGVTNNEQAWRYGRYMLSQAVLRQENISITVDFENLVCTRGDYVLYQNDIMKVGGTPARVKNVSGTEIKIDTDISTIGGINYGYTFRNSSGIFTSTLTPVDSETFIVDGIIPNIGDIIIIGEVDKITIDLLVKEIIPNADLTANLVLVEKADEIHEAEKLIDIPPYDPQFSKNIDTELSAPSEVTDLQVFDNSFRCFNGGYEYFVDLLWNTPEGSVVSVYEIYVDFGSGMNLVDYSSTETYRYIVGENQLGKTHYFKIIAVSANGNKLPLGEVGSVSTDPISKIDPPSDVDGLYINILNETLQLDWEKILDCDTKNYLIRYSPSLEASWESSIPLQTVNSDTSLASFQARTGSYFIKAIDWNGNESLNAKKAITSIPNLVNLNIIEETNDFPSLNGAKDQVVLFGNSLILQEKNNGDPSNIEYYSEGYYYFDNFLDLGEIYTARIQSLIEAEGYTTQDIIANWDLLSNVALMSNSRTSEWSVETQYRATDELIVMSSWVTLDSIDPISEGTQEKWTDWRKFTIGDFTGRIFQFRLKLISNKPSVSPRVFNGVIRSDMPDRIESFNNIVAPGVGITINYNPSFKGPDSSPNISITQDNAISGDEYEITNKSLNGFTIAFKDKNGNPVARQFDAMVKGYGRKSNEIL